MEPYLLEKMVSFCYVLLAKSWARYYILNPCYSHELGAWVCHKKKLGSIQILAFELVQTELLSTLDVKAKLEERLENYAKEAAYLKKKADDYSNELRDLILKVRRY